MNLSALTLLVISVTGRIECGGMVVAFAPTTPPLPSSTASSSSAKSPSWQSRRGGRHRMPHTPSTSIGSSSSSSDDTPAKATNLQSVLRFLERRIEDGPGTSSAGEVSRFEREAGEVIRRMYEEEGAGGRSPGHDALPGGTPPAAEEGGEGRTSPYRALKRRSLVPERTRQSEWDLREGEGAPERRGAATRRESRQTPRNEKAARVTMSLSTPLSVYTRKGWRGDGARPSPPERGKASKAKESTASFAHGREENRQRPLRPAQSALGVSPGYFQMFVGDQRQGYPPKAAAAKTSLVETEARVRPVPSTDVPAYANTRDHRDSGDVEDPAPTSRRPRGPTALLATEGRSRRVASTQVLAHARQRDWRSVGDARDARNSRAPEADRGRAPAGDYRGPGDARPPPPAPLTAPAPAAARRRVAERWGAGDTRSLTRRATPPPASGAASATAASLSDAERIFRLISPSSGQSQSDGRVTDRRRSDRRVTDRWGPRDTRSLTQQTPAIELAASSPLAATASLSDAERSFRPVPPSSGQTQSDQRVTDRWGPGDVRSLTNQRLATDLAASSPLAATTSLSDTERSFRPVPPSSGQAQHDQRVTDRWGPGDVRPLTNQRLATDLASSSPLAATASLSDTERSFRPAAPSSAQSQHVEAADRRGPARAEPLLKEETRTMAVGGDGAAAEPPIAALRRSSLQGLLNGELRPVGNAIIAAAPSSPLSSPPMDDRRRVASKSHKRGSPAYELEWWGEKD